MTDRICCEPNCNRPAAKGNTPRCGSCHHRWQKAHGKKHTVTCAMCGRDFQTHRVRSKRPCCSVECRRKLTQPEMAKASAAAAARRRRDKYGVAVVLYVKPKRTWAPTQTRGRATWRSGPCKVCGKHYTTWNIDVTCSPECHAVRHREARAVHKARRRARKRNAYRADVYRKDVFEADGYRCHICGKKTDSTKEAPHPMAPTIDHLIPLAKGGTHEPINCRTAHFICNSRKGDRGGGDQLLLIA